MSTTLSETLDAARVLANLRGPEIDDHDEYEAALRAAVVTLTGALAAVLAVDPVAVLGRHRPRLSVHDRATCSCGHTGVYDDFHLLDALRLAQHGAATSALGATCTEELLP